LVEHAPTILVVWVRFQVRLCRRLEKRYDSPRIHNSLRK